LAFFVFRGLGSLSDRLFRFVCALEGPHFGSSAACPGVQYRRLSWRWNCLSPPSTTPSYRTFLFFFRALAFFSLSFSLVGFCGWDGRDLFYYFSPPRVVEFSPLFPLNLVYLNDPALLIEKYATLNTEHLESGIPPPIQIRKGLIDSNPPFSHSPDRNSLFLEHARLPPQF